MSSSWIDNACIPCFSVGKVLAENKTPDQSLVRKITQILFGDCRKGKLESRAGEFLTQIQKRTRKLNADDIFLLTGVAAFLLIHSSEVQHKDYDPWFTHRSWLLRPSRYRERGGAVVSAIVGSLGRWDRTKTILGESVVDSLKQLCNIYPEAIQCHRSLASTFSTSEAETILGATVFLADDKYRNSSNPPKSHLWPDALSLILDSYKKSNRKITSILSPTTDESILGKAASLLNNAISVITFQDIEERVLMLGYSLSLSDDSHRFSLGHPNKDTLISHLSWPHQRDERRFGVARAIASRNPNPLLRDAILNLVESGEIHVVPQRGNPGLGFVLTQAACLLAASNDLYKEEIEALWNVAVNLGYNPVSLLDIVIEGTSDVTVLDLLLVQRVFSIINHSLEASMAKYGPGSPHQSLTSKAKTFVLPLGTSVLCDILEACYGWGKEKTTSVTELMSTNLSSSGRIDILSRPLLRVNNGFRVPLAIATGSNLIRNVFQFTKTRVPSAGKRTPDWLANQTVSHFKRAGWTCVASDATPEHETDVVAMKDGILFVLECKSTISPTCPIEEQRSWSAMRKAAEQLSLRKSDFSRPDAQREILRLMNADDRKERISEVVTAIITGSGHMEGHRIDGHCVISVDGLGGFLENPSQVGSIGEIILHWTGDIPDTQSVKRYLTGGYWNQALRASATIVHYQEHIGSITVDYPALSVNLDTMQCALDDERLGQ